MRGQHTYCLRSVTSKSHCGIVLFPFYLFNHTTAGPTFFVERKELHTGRTRADTALYFEQEFSLMDFAQFTGKGAILDALKAVIQAGIGNLRSYAIMRNIINEQTAHRLTTLRRRDDTAPVRRVQRGQDGVPDSGG